MTTKKRIIRTFLLALVGLGIGGFIAWVQVQSDHGAQSAQNDLAPRSVAGIALDPAFALTDHTGQEVTEANYDGQYKLVYFGFTYCPAICPTELQKITKVLEELDPAQAEKIQPLFITIDPERDTVDVMREYVTLFHPRLVGLTGTVEEIEQVKSGYKVFAAKAPTEDGSDYTMDHSSFIYLMGPDNRTLAIYRMQDDAEMIRNDVTQILTQS